MWVARHSEELKRGITIKLGYADTPIYECPKCEPPFNYSTKTICPNCGSPTKFVRAVSFVDAPGHEALMATMLSGAAVMDGAILVIAADEKCPQPQTREHLAAIEVMNVKNLVIVQNKIDIVSEERARESYYEIKDFVKGTIAEDAPIIPVSAQHRINIDILLNAIQERIPTPKRDLSKPPKMYIVRSFDINKPGTPIEEISGGVIGGSVLQGSFRVDDEIEISPGLRGVAKNKVTYNPLFTKIVSLYAGGRSVKEAKCGGLVGIGTLLDPSLTKADGLIGNIVGKPGDLPKMLWEIDLKIRLFDRAVGTKDMMEVKGVQKNESLLIHIGTAISLGTVTDTRKGTIRLKLSRPVCVEKGDRAAISRKILGRWRLIGYGLVT